MIKKILVANRGEIANRIIRTCKKMGIKTVSIYSNEDKDGMHVFMADESVCTEKENQNDGYLNMNNIIQAAINTNCDAIHTGYGFLSESYEFAKRVEESGLVLIGTKAEIMKKVENKFEIKNRVKQMGIPVIQDFRYGKVQEKDFPVLVKSSAGAGGRGIKKVNSLLEFEKVYKELEVEDKDSFNKDNYYIEKFIKGYRHIEIQFAADKYGNIIVFPERDCSLQIDYKKIIEITPSSNIEKDIIENIKEDTIKIVKELNYINIGTAEFLVDLENNYYFLEINPRIQVEHTITEMITDIDLVKMQIEISDNKSIKEYKKIEEIKLNKYAIEARINALECNKKIEFCNFPLGDGIRIETYIFNGMKISANYDPLIIKLICIGDTRNDAIQRLKIALEELIIEGIETNINYIYEIITNEEFINGEYNMEFLKK